MASQFGKVFRKITTLDKIAVSHFCKQFHQLCHVDHMFVVVLGPQVAHGHALFSCGATKYFHVIGLNVFHF
jgi:hypothetical protein